MAIMEIDQFRELAAAVTRHLPMIDSREAQLLIDEPRRLATILVNAFQSPEIHCFEVVVTGTIPYDEHADNFLEEDLGVDNATHWMDTYCKSKWPQKDAASRTLEFHLEKFGVPLTGAKAIEELALRGLRPATLVETVFFFCQYAYFIQEYAYCVKALLRMEMLKPMVILDLEDDEIDGQLAMIAATDMHSSWMGMTHPANTIYPAVKK